MRLVAMARRDNYDANGNRTLERVNRTGGAQVTTYAFNDVDQLTRSERSDIQGITRTDWTYDAVGSRSSETVTTTAAAAGSSPLVTTRGYTYNARNQLTGISQSGAQGSLSTTYQYDPQGNQIQKARDGQITAFTYDAHDQLIQISRNGSVLGTYRNNLLGLRIEKEAKDPLNPQGPPVRLRTLWDGHSAVMDRSTDNTGADNVIARYDFAGREPIGLWHKQDGAQALHSDALGSVVLTTDTAGAAQAETLFDAWGNPIVEAGQSANKFGYTGHQMDDESGLIYTQARYYDPETGRFLTLDPAEANPDIPLTYNSYLYAYGNPTVWIDPDGRSATVAGAVVGFFWGFGQMAGGMVNDVVDGSSRSTWEYLGLWGQNIVAGAELGASIDVGLMSGGTAVVASGALGGAGFEALTFGGRGKSGAEFFESQLVGAGTGAAFSVAGKLAAPLIGKAAQAGGNATKAVAERLGAGELLEAGMLRASNVAANVETKLGNLARTGSTNAEAAGVSTTVSSVAKPGSVVTRELAQGPGAGASVNTAAKSVVAETLPAKLVDRPMYGSAGASSLTRRQYVKANLVESHAINDNLGAGFSQFVQKERALAANSAETVAGTAANPALAARLDAFKAWKESAGIDGAPTSAQFRRFMGAHRPNSRGETFYDANTSGFADWSRRVDSVHGNTAGSQPTWLYKLESADGGFLKWGISQDPFTRYSGPFMRDKIITPLQLGPRRDILKAERNLVETQPGPLNFEPWRGTRQGTP